MQTTTTHQAPPRSYQQRLEALVIANASRVANKNYKDKVRQGKIDPFTAIAECDIAVKTEALLCVMPKIGPTKAQKIMRRAEVGSTKRMNGLTSNQRVRLAAELRLASPHYAVK